MKLKRSAAMAIAFLSAFILAGCDNNDKPQEAQAAPAAAAPAASQTPAAVKPDGEKL